jgi:hypothetical protein
MKHPYIFSFNIKGMSINVTSESEVRGWLKLYETLAWYVNCM